MRRLIGAVALSLISGGAWAQDTAALARDYVALPANQAMMEDMLGPESMAAQFAAGLPPGVDLSDDQLARVGAVMAEAMGGLRPRMEELMIEGSAETFTAEELQALIDFYGTEPGASILLKNQEFFQGVMGTLTPEIMGAMEGVMPQILEIVEGG